MTTPPFMPPPFLDIVIAIIFRAGGEGRIRDVVMEGGDTTESRRGFNKDRAWEEAAGGGGKTEVGDAGTAIGRGGESQRAGEGGVVRKEGEGDGCGGGRGDKFTDGGGAVGSGDGDTDGRGGRDGEGKEGKVGGVDNGSGDDWGWGGGERHDSG
ncbi:glycine-rich cell wall structural protein 1.0-like [Coffea eugenioides]|uniref:glycine-rich cell wall structural protein 1.0-like n=1 Tax=Coffea eugenioides TaxID=49369 RepID=UPI000F6131CF|nr:glycine-rich cell wall structural protein 1.0-like [Coffea eugenioides]